MIWSLHKQRWKVSPQVSRLESHRFLKWRILDRKWLLWICPLIIFNVDDLLDGDRIPSWRWSWYGYSVWGRPPKNAVFIFPILRKDSYQGNCHVLSHLFRKGSKDCMAIWKVCHHSGSATYMIKTDGMNWQFQTILELNKFCR